MYTGRADVYGHRPEKIARTKMKNENRIMVFSLVCVSLIFSSCTSQAPNPLPPNSNSAINSNSATTPANTLANNSNAPSSEVSIPIAPALRSEAEQVARKKIDEKFQTCSDNDSTETLTYTMLDDVIFEIKGFDHEVIADKDRPTFIDRENETPWVGKIVLNSLSTRSYGLSDDCWSKYYSKFDKMPLTFWKEEGSWNLTGLSDYVKPLCSDISKLNERKCSK